jgi:hypothetical protein
MAEQGIKNEASHLIDEKIASLSDWRGETLRQIRDMITNTVPDVIEEWKWRGTPVWSLNGILCTGEVYRDKVKVTFPKGARMNDPQHLFNASLDGNQRRAIDFFENDLVPMDALSSLFTQAVLLNAQK